MVQTVRRDARRRGGRSGAAARRLTAAILLSESVFSATPAQVEAQEIARRIERGRFSIVAYPLDLRLAHALLDAAIAEDTFPGLPRPAARVIIGIAPDAARFREWSGPRAPDWGSAIAFPELQRVILQGRSGNSGAGDPPRVLRHELAHLALHEMLGDLPPRWFDEGYAGYAAGEWGRAELLATNVALAVRGVPSLDSLDAGFSRGSADAAQSYALAYRAVADLAAQDPSRGLALFFRYWKETGSMDQAIRSAYGLTQTAFEAQWRRRTRMRYGALAFVTDLGFAALLLLVLIVPLYLARRRRDRARLAALRVADEDEERRAVADAIEELLRSVGPSR